MTKLFAETFKTFYSPFHTCIDDRGGVSVPGINDWLLKNKSLF